MVFFTCEKCGEALKKNQVSKHIFKCNSKVFSCIDCQKVFDIFSFGDHIKCISEDQKYGGANYVEKAKKGELRQNTWVEQVSLAIQSVTDSRLKRVLRQVEGQSNIPRKEAKFINFLRNSLRIQDPALCSQAWAAISEGAKRIKAALEAAKNGGEKPADEECLTNGNNKADETTDELTAIDTTCTTILDSSAANTTTTAEESPAEAVGEANGTETVNDTTVESLPAEKPFKWRAAIKRRLKSDENGGAMKLKRLRRDVIAESLAHATQSDADAEHLKEVFAQKLEAIGGVRVDGKMVYLA